MTVKEDFVVKNKKYEFVPPDGGWGYMIWISTIIVYSSGTMFIGCFGMIFKDLLVELNMGSTSVTLLFGVDTICLAVTGYFTGPLLKIMSLRNVAYLGSFVFNLGVLCTVFCTTQVELFIYQGVQCGGFGILYNLSCTLINDYFLKKRFLSVSITQTMSAVAAMVAPQFVKWSLEEYGFRGTQLLTSAISMQTFVAVVMMQPAELHMKRVETSDTEEIKLLLLDEKTADTKNMKTPTIKFTDVECSFDDKIKSDIDNNLQGDGETNNEFKNMVTEMFDATVMKKFFTSNASVGPAICIAFESMFLVMLPQALYSMGWDKDRVAQAVSLVALGDLATRMSFIFFSNWLIKIGSQEIYVIGIAIAAISRFGMLWSENVTVILICITLMGIPHCTITVLPPLIMSDTFTSTQFSSAMGIFMMLLGVLNLILGPAIGAVRDMTDSYPTAFYIITSCFCVVLLMWTIELVYKKNKHKRKLQEIARKERALKKNKSKA